MNEKQFFSALSFLLLILASNVFGGQLKSEVIPTKLSFEQSDIVYVTLTFTNLGDETVSIPDWFLQKQLFNDLFNITRNGQWVRYEGPISKRLKTTEHFALNKGQSRSEIIDVSSAYSFDQTGDYVIQFDQSFENLIQNLNDPNHQSISITGHCFVSARLSPSAERRRGKALATSRAITFNQCSAAQITTINKAIPQAKIYLNGAVSYLNNQVPRATRRYKTWFGAFFLASWNRVKSNFRKIRTVFFNNWITIDCSCTSTGIYAYVYLDEPYTIYPCPYFWEQSVSGTDSQSGALIHEVSHFNVVVATRDYAGGQEGAKDLAINDRPSALLNADNYEYFAENTPYLP